VEEEMEEKFSEKYNKRILTGIIQKASLRIYILPKQAGDGSRLEGYSIISKRIVYGKLIEEIIAK
jgi:hypothetical protein